MAWSREDCIRQNYAILVKRTTPREAVGARVLRAFFVGGGLAVTAHTLTQGVMAYLALSRTAAEQTTLLVLIALGCLLTGLRRFDDLSQWAGAGVAVPITGFANSVAAAALEYRTEGWVLGVAGNMFRLAGVIVVFGIVAACGIALILWSYTQIAQVWAGLSLAL